MNRNIYFEVCACKTEKYGELLGEFTYSYNVKNKRRW